MSDELSIGPMTAHDWPSVARIYRAGIAAGNATFEHTVPEWGQWRASRLERPCLVARGQGGEVLGWAALTPVSSRPVYRGVAEVSVYVDPGHARRGVGRALLRALVEESEREGIWTLRAGIFPENEASIRLHESCDFRLLGTHERMGQMPDGRWRDVVLYERRSGVVGRA
ncbi:MAG TPA: GNAT family N-acetyltransferase [Solirubrobacteraceae bacterium]|jgi:L-amino acid N-acyltransferase YncA|nr:GNAT family N-acetyltransferase [Solirubrobacteraceae bacterium]